MPQLQIIELRDKIYQLLAEKRLKESFAELSKLITQLQDWKSSEQLSEVETSYQYMLRYMLQGVDDPDRAKIYNRLLTSAYNLTDQIVEKLLIKESPLLYYSRKRYISSTESESIKSVFERLDNQLNNLSLCDLLEEPTEKDLKMIAIQKTIEKEIAMLFDIIWTNDSATAEDYQALKQLFKPGMLPMYLCATAISALTLNLLHCFDEQKLNILLDVYTNENPELNQRALVGALIVMYNYKNRISNYPAIQKRLETLNEETRLKKEIQNIQLQFIKSFETEKIGKKITEEIIPEMMRVTPGILNKIKSEDLYNDSSAFDKNPEWEEMFEKSGISDKLKEISELQMEGADIFMTTFAAMKKLPFFNNMCNWFMPFTTNISIFKEQFIKNPQLNSNVFTQMSSSLFMCNSDKYSLFISMTKMPASQLDMFSGKLNGDIEEMNKETNESLKAQSNGKADIISNQYIQDLYRFYKLFPRKSEFNDPFATELKFYEIDFLKEIIQDNDSLRLFAEYYFKKEHYSDALSLFKILSDRDHTNSELYQKCGYCLQMQGDYAYALKFYIQADTIHHNSFWTIRRIALCYRHLNNPDLALSYYLQAEKLNPDNLSIIMNIGHCYLELENYAEALNTYFKVEYLDPKAVKPLRAIAWCSFLSKKYEQAQRYYQKILEQQPDATDYLNAGHIEWKLGNIKQAYEYYLKCIGVLGSMNKFREAFDADSDTLIEAGIPSSDIPIMLDQLMYNLS